MMFIRDDAPMASITDSAGFPITSIRVGRQFPSLQDPTGWTWPDSFATRSSYTECVHLRALAIMTATSCAVQKQGGGTEVSYLTAALTPSPLPIASCAIHILRHSGMYDLE